MQTLRRLFPLVSILSSLACIATAAPSLTGVFNAASSVPAGLPNSGIAEGSIFIVKGSGMGPGTLQEVTSYPLPTSQGLGGTTIQVTVGGSTAYCIMVYTSFGQLAAILPSGTPVGSGTLTVAYQGSQATIPIQVVKNSFGIFSINQQGSGPGVVTNSSYQTLFPTNAGHPGDVLVIWGTGLGPITGDETVAPQQVDLGTGVQVFVGGQAANVLYGGRGSSSGLDQIDFTVPSGLSGCYTSLVVQVAGVVSNFATIPIAPAGQTFCSDPGGLSSAQQSKVLNGGTLNLGRISINTVDGDLGSASFTQINFTDMISSHGLGGGPSAGGCTVYVVPSGNGIVSADPFSIPTLDAGPQLNLQGPSGSKTLSLISKGVYGGVLSAKGQTAYLVPGNYTINNGNGGADIGAFTANLTVGSPLVWTNESTTKTASRSGALHITWTGGGPNDLVSIIGNTGLASIRMDTQFWCTAPASAGQFTIPQQVLNLLPPAGIEANGEAGADLLVGLVPSFAAASFSAPNLDYGVFFSYVDSAVIVSITQ